MGLSFTNWRICIVATWGRQTLDGGRIGVPYCSLLAKQRLRKFANRSLSVQAK
jgi:hypothetical protein